MDNIFKPRISKIVGMSDRRRLPRLGKIRLGVKVVSKKTGNEYPKETDYFVCPPEVTKAYKEEFPDGEIKTLDVMFPVNDIEVIFPQAYKFYGKTKGLKCAGNGELAYRAGENGSFKEISCPCEKLESGQCSQRANLMVLLPKVNLGGIYQIDVGSYHSIVDVNSGIDYVRAVMKQTLGLDRFAMIPLLLKREPKETHHEGGKQIHYTLRLFLNVTIEQLNEMKSDNRILRPPQFALPPVEEVNPEFDEGATIEEEEKQEEEPLASKEIKQEIENELTRYDKEIKERVNKQIEENLTQKDAQEILQTLRNPSESLKKHLSKTIEPAEKEPSTAPSEAPSKSKLTKQQEFGLKLLQSHLFTEEEKSIYEGQIRDPELRTNEIVNDIKIEKAHREGIEKTLLGDKYKGIKLDAEVIKTVITIVLDTNTDKELEKIQKLVGKVDWKADKKAIIAVIEQTMKKKDMVFPDYPE